MALPKIRPVHLNRKRLILRGSLPKVVRWIFLAILESLLVSVSSKRDYHLALVSNNKTKQAPILKDLSRQYSVNLDRRVPPFLQALIFARNLGP